MVVCIGHLEMIFLIQCTQFCVDLSLSLSWSFSESFGLTPSILFMFYGVLIFSWAIMSNIHDWPLPKFTLIYPSWFDSPLGFRVLVFIFVHLMMVLRKNQGFFLVIFLSFVLIFMPFILQFAVLSFPCIFFFPILELLLNFNNCTREIVHVRSLLSSQEDL